MLSPNKIYIPTGQASLMKRMHMSAVHYVVLLLIFTLLLPAKPLLAQDSLADSLNYELQRQKVNQLLDQRTARFGHFDESLKKRTGIFGLKTKKDMQASIDILETIVQTDNAIFAETKKLLDFKDQMLDFKEFEKERVAELAQEYDQRINGYISTISKLQQEQDRLKAEIRELQNRKNTSNGLTFLFIVLLAGGGFFLWYRKNKLNAQKTLNN